MTRLFIGIPRNSFHFYGGSLRRNTEHMKIYGVDLDRGIVRCVDTLFEIEVAPS